MRILNLDIELAPAICYVWDLRIPGGYISPDKIISGKKLLCLAGKWVGEDDLFFFSSWDDGEEAMLHQIWQLLDQAEAVLHFNGTRFDIPYINTEFVQAELSPPSPYGQIDLLKAVRKQFKFMSNSLDSVSKTLGTEHKLSHEGFSLWTKVMAGDRQAQCKMEEYCCGDVFANEDLYHRILPWIPAHPSYALVDGTDVCPQCGSASVEPSGVAYTPTRAYPRYHCTSCLTWLRGTHSLAGAGKRTMS